MARDPNKSGNGNNPNEIGDSLSSRIEEIGRSAYSIPAEERELRRKARVAGQGIDIYQSLSEIAQKYEPVQILHKKNINTLSRTQPRIRIGTEARLERITNQAVNEIGRTFDDSSINRSVGELSLTQQMQQASAMYASTNYTNLYARSAQIHQDIGGLRGRAFNAAQNYFNKRGVNSSAQSEMQGIDKELQAKLQELAPINIAMKAQRAAGLDPESKMSALMGRRAEADALLSAANPSRSHLSSLGMSQLKELELRQAKRLSDAFKELEEAAKKGATNLDHLQKKAERTADNLGKTQDAIRQNGGYGGGGGTNWLALAQGGFGAIGGAIQQVGVNQRLAQMGNVTGYANFSNDIYQTYKSAAGGNIASLLALPQFKGAAGFGGSLKFAANLAVGAQAAAGVAQVGMGVTEGGATLNPLSDAFNSSAAAASLKAGAQDIIGGTATTAVAGFDLARQVSARQAAVAGMYARMNAVRAVQAVNADQLQGFRDFGVNLGQASIGLGARGEGFLSRTVSDANMSRMAAFRVSPDQFAQMAGQGISQMGSTFNESQIFGARALERRGLGTMSENMSRMAMLSSAGGNNPQDSFARVLEAALPKGLDSSKALNAVVQHTATMAAASAGRVMGLDTTGVTASLLTFGINKNTPNKEAAIERSATAQQIANQYATNTGANFASMTAIARTQRTLGGGGIEALVAEGVDTQTLMSIGGLKDRKAKEKALLNLGINPVGKDVDKMLSGLISNRQHKLFESGGKGFVIPGANEEELLSHTNKAGSFDQMSSTDQLNLSRIGRLSGYQTGGEFFNVVRGVTAPVNPGAPTGVGAMNLPSDKEIGPMRRSMDDLRTLGFVQLTTAAQAAATNLGGASDAVAKLTLAFQGLEKAMPGVEKKAGSAAGLAAGGGDMLDVSGFNSSIKKLDYVLDKAMGKAGLGNDTRTRVAPPHH